MVSYSYLYFEKKSIFHPSLYQEFINDPSILKVLQEETPSSFAIDISKLSTCFLHPYLSLKESELDQENKATPSIFSLTLCIQINLINLKNYNSYLQTSALPFFQSHSTDESSPEISNASKSNWEDVYLNF